MRKPLPDRETRAIILETCRMIAPGKTWELSRDLTTACFDDDYRELTNKLGSGYNVTAIANGIRITRKLK